MTTSLRPDYFEVMFANDSDPWQLETSPYEAQKYDRTIGALAGRRYHRTLEIGCAGGVLTERLARQCDLVIALDVSSTALKRAKARCNSLPHVIFHEMQFPKTEPVGHFDLIVMSEVAYYWDDLDLSRAAAFVSERLEQRGDLLLVHWIRETDYPQTGDEAVSKLQRGLPEMTTITSHRTPDYRLDLWRR